MRLLATTFLLITLAVLSSCAGYQFGTPKPDHLIHLKTIHLPPAKSRVIFPRIEALATNTMATALVNDGTYRLASVEKADAALLLTIEKLEYRQIRSSQFDVLRSEELELQVTLSYQLINSSGPSQILDQGTTTGRSRLFVDDNLQTARQNALPDALQRASQNLISRLAHGL